MSLLGVEECCAMGGQGSLCMRGVGHPEAHRDAHGVEWWDGAKCANTDPPKTEGRKDDAGKPRFSLLPWTAIARVVDVLEFGAKKYGVDNWQKVESPKERYLDAALRHLVARLSGEIYDKGPGGSGQPHLACAVCSLLFALWFDEKETKR